MWKWIFPWGEEELPKKREPHNLNSSNHYPNILSGNQNMYTSMWHFNEHFKWNPKAQSLSFQKRGTTSNFMSLQEYFSNHFQPTQSPFSILPLSFLSCYSLFWSGKEVTGVYGPEFHYWVFSGIINTGYLPEEYKNANSNIIVI